MSTPKRILEVIMVLLVLPLCGFGQTLDDGNQGGYPPNVGFSGSNFDNVSTLNGNLHLDIPMFSAKQRGGRDISYHFVYDNPYWTMTYYPSDGYNPAYTVIDQSRDEGDQNGRFSASDSYSLYWNWYNNTITCTIGTQTYTHNLYNGFAVVDSDGTKHPLYLYAEGATPYCAPVLLTGTTSDGSGFYADITAAMATDPPDFSKAKVWKKDGTQVIGVGAWVDANGNSKETLGRTLVTTTGSNIAFVNSNGGTQNYVADSTLNLVSRLTLPNNMHYDFTYSQDSNTNFCQFAYTEVCYEDDRGARYLTDVTLPTGGTISYSYLPKQYPSGISWRIAPINVRYSVTSRTVTSDGQSATWNYAGGTVTLPTGDQEEHTYTAFSRTKAETQVRFLHNGSAVRTITKDYAYEGDPWTSSGTNLRQIRQTTTLDNGLVSKRETDYETFTFTYAGITYTSTRLNAIAHREYDFGSGAPGALLRNTTTTYLHQSSSNYLTRNIVNKPYLKQVFDGQGVLRAKTQNYYDTTAISQTSGVVQHDYTNFPYSMIYRGNLTEIKNWRNTDGAWLTTTNYYDDLGNLVQTKDPLLHSTTFDYTDDWGQTSCAPAGQSKAYVTTVTNPLWTERHNKYNSCTGSLFSSADANGQTTYLDHDSFDRVTGVRFPDGGHVQNIPNDLTSYEIAHTVAAAPDPDIVTFVRYNGVGRIKQTETASVKTDTTYDLIGRVYCVSNPYAGTSTDGSVCTEYDPLNRVQKVTKQNNDFVGTVYSGNTTTVTDEAGKARKFYTDGLGRLIEVDEPGKGPDSITPATAGTGSVTVSGTLQGSGGSTSTGSVTISGSEGRKYICPDGAAVQSKQTGSLQPQSCLGGYYVYNAGSVTITVGTFSKSTSYGQNSTSSSVASALVTAINFDGSSPVTAQLSGSIVNLTSKSTGTAANYSLSTSCTYDTANFTSCSFAGTRSGATMTGGTNGTYDSGTTTITINGQPVSYSWSGSTTTSASIASGLAGAVNTNSSYATANASGTTVNLTARTTGSGTNYTLSVSTTQQYSSFSSSASGPAFTGGADQQTTVPPYSLSTPYVTLYKYDTLGNLTCVEQHGYVTGTGCSADPSNDPSSPWRVRRFTYDSLSELLSARNPEVNATTYTTYTYNNDGVVTSKTDQRGITINYDPSDSHIDALHRVTKKAYSNGETSVTYRFDEATDNGLSITNGKGRRTGMSDISGLTAWSYDAMGRPVAERRTIATVTKGTSFIYDLAGGLSSVTYPSGRTIGYVQSPAGYPVSARDAVNNITYAANALYAPFGALASLQLGSAPITITNAYNVRLQPDTMSAGIAGNSPLMSRSYNFRVALGGDNGNMWAITDGLDNPNSATRPIGSTNFDYDDLNRIKSASTTGTNCDVMQGSSATRNYGNSYTVDAWGNLYQKTVTKCSAETLGETVANNNQFAPSNRYDTAGNMTASQTQVNQYKFNAESQLIGLTSDPAPPVLPRYLFDGDGIRVAKTLGAVTSYWPDPSGEVLAESDASGNIVADYIFFGAKRIARIDATVHYYISDHINSATVVTNNAGTSEREEMYFPFGAERWASGTDPNHYKFTGKERDTETNLDYFGARYFNSAPSRWMSPDFSVFPSPVPYASLPDPQSLNLFSYLRNSPMATFDADGHDLAGCTGGGWGQTCQEQAQEELSSSRDSDSYAQDPDPQQTTAQNQNNQPAPTNPDGSPKAPPTTDNEGNPIVPGVEGWKPGPGSAGGDRDTRWGPTQPVPADPSKGQGQPNASWDPNGHWDIKTGNKGETVRVLPNGTRVDHDNNPIKSSIHLPTTRQVVIGIGAVGTGYLIYRGVRMLPSVVFPPLWPTIPLNAAIP